jgi:hypothetical protein
MLRQVFTTALLVGTVTSLAAQQPPASTPGVRQSSPPNAQAVEGAIDPPALPEGQLVVMLDTYALFQAQQQLSIPDEKFGVFAARLKKLQDVRRRNQRIRRQIVQELRRLAGPRVEVPADEATIRKQLAALREQDDRAAAELRQAYDALDEVLDARQQARYRIFEEVIEQRKIDLLVRARQRAQQEKGGAGTRK